MESFPIELKTLTAGKPIKNSSEVATYSPFIGPAGIIRSTGRIVRLLRLLDARYTLVSLLARSLHHKQFHQGLDYMRSVLNIAYAVLGLRRLLRSIESQCVLCRKRKASTIQSIMSDLPVERLGCKQPPFNHTGVDYFGPLYAPVRRSTEKRWGFLFNCLTTRDVQLEIVSSLDTSSCDMGIERFIARRGLPSTIWSDYGTNFVGAEKELLACIKNWNGMAPTIFPQKGIAWKFNPPDAPHHGGSWERLVRSVKRVLYDILSSRRVTEEILGTTLCLVEQALNSRPITPVCTDSRELEALTPNHFCLDNMPHAFLRFYLGSTSTTRKGTCERSHMLTRFGLVGFANMCPRLISVSSGTLILTSL